MDDFERRGTDTDYAMVYEPARDSMQAPQRRAGDRFSEANRRDAEIAQSARSLLQTAAYLTNGSSPNVAVKGGWVTLWGEVERDYKRQPAARAVFRLPGVYGVTDQITLRQREDVTDEA
jgi:osmotically-inducible protein OsmY